MGNLSITQLSESQENKETTINDQNNELDLALSDNESILVDDSNLRTLTAAEWTRNILFSIQDGAPVPTATITLTVPSTKKGIFVVQNLTSFAVDVEISGQPLATPSVAADTVKILMNDGTNVREPADIGSDFLSLDQTPSSFADASGMAVRVNAGETAIEFVADAWKIPVRAATLVTGTLASAYENGDTIDGVSLSTGDRILIKNQSTGSENGIYTVNASGAPTRTIDFDDDADAIRGSMVAVLEGTVQSQTFWIHTTSGAITIGSTALTFAPMPPAPQVQTFTGSGTWTKPPYGDVAFVECWGGGGSGGKGNTGGGGGGGGGAYNSGFFPIGDLGATETVTVGSGGASQTTSGSNGSVGGNTTFGSLLTSFGGGGGGGDSVTAGSGGGGGGGLSAGGNASTTIAGAGGDPDGGAIPSEAVGEPSSFGGASGGDGSGRDGGASGWGGGSGGSGITTTGGGNGGDSMRGGAGGGGSADSSPGAGGTSELGGDGGAAGAGASVGVAGTQPGGGGGGSETGNSGAGADGQCRVTVW